MRGEGRVILDVLFLILDCWKLGEIVTKRGQSA